MWSDLVAVEHLHLSSIVGQPTCQRTGNRRLPAEGETREPQRWPRRNPGLVAAQGLRCVGVAARPAGPPAARS